VVEAPIEPPAIELPDLNVSDDFMLTQLQEFDLPEMWTNREDLLRRLAVVVDNAAEGKYPARQLGFLAPTGSFKIQREGERLFVDPAGYERFDTHVDVLTAMDPERVASMLELISPLLQEGMRELGNTRSVETELKQAIDEVMAVPVRRQRLELIQPNVLYEYADPRLEDLSDLQKQVLRMGPDNVARLQRYLVRLEAALAD
jgi:hypothetical protein